MSYEVSHLSGKWTRIIESIRVVARVRTLREGQALEQARVPASEINPGTWRLARLVVAEGTDRQVDVTLLRPQSWLELHGVEVGETVELNLPEHSARGPAKVLSIEACPEIEEGDESRTRVVTATFRHGFGYPWDLRVEGVDEPIGVTRHHLVWSVDRERWVAVAALRRGERVRLSDSETRVESVTSGTLSQRLVGYVDHP